MRPQTNRVVTASDREVWFDFSKRHALTQVLYERGVYRFMLDTCG